MNIKKTVFTYLIVLVGSISLTAQSSGTSPYSKLGLGDFISTDFTNIRNMGGTGISFTDAYLVNPSNPASYSSLRMAAFDIGLYAKRSNLSDESGKSKVWSGNINNIALAFPMRNPINDILDRTKKDFSWGMGLNLMPYSLVGYNLTSSDEDENIGKITNKYIGKGGTYRFLWGNAVSYKDISFGLHLGYLFGNIEHNRSLRFDDLDFPFNNFYSVDYHVSGFLWDLGFLYTLDFNKDKKDQEDLKTNKLVFGLTYNSKSNFSTKADIFNITQQPLTKLRDTSRISNLEGTGTLPSKIGFGVNYYNGSRWNIGINYSITSWSQFKNDIDPTTFVNGNKISIGGFYRPNAKSYSNFFNRVYYQFGAYYKKDPRVIKNENINSYGVTMGMGLPYVYKRKISHANIGVDIGKKGANTIIKENYIKINLGFTFNDDSWFIKRKYN